MNFMKNTIQEFGGLDTPYLSVLTLPQALELI